MTDVFISYSRRDKVFTQKLVNALQAVNREVWADWASIPAASDWDAEIKEGIEKTNTVLFVLSPEWIKSNECRKEMVHAIQHGKHLVPILHIMPDQGQEVPPELARLNWVYMRETDDFDKAFETLQSAMDTDLDWVKTHTRIQVRAIEWNKKNRDNSFTLRGKDLTDGEQFISGAAGKSPEPTQLQGEYVLASRKDATRRQRITLAGVTIALVVSIALGIVAYFQRQAAIVAQAEAVLNSKIALARELTASARTSLETDPEQSILLVLQASQITTDAGQGILSSTENILRESIQTSRLRYKVTIPGDQVLSIALSPNGEYLAAGTTNGQIIVWKVYNIPNHVETSNNFPETVWFEPYYTFLSTGNPVESVTFSPDSKLLATSSDDTGVPAVWDVSSKTKLFNLYGDIGWIWNVVYSPDGQTLATAGEDGIVRLWNINGANTLNIDAHGHYRVTGLAFSPDGQRIISAGESGQLVFSDVGTGSTIDTYSDDSVLVYLAYNPKGNQIAFGNSSYNVKILDLNTNEVLNTKYHKDRAAKLAFSPDGSMLASAGIDATTYVIDPNTGNVIFSLVGDSNDIFDVTFTPDGQYIVTGNADGEIKIWDASIIPPSEAGSITTQSEPGTGLAFSPDGTKLITSADEPSGYLYNFVSSELTTMYNDPIWINDVAMSPDQTLIATGRENGSVVIWDAATGKKINEVSSAENQIPYDVEYSLDGKLLLSGAGYVDIWDAKGKELISRINTGDDDTIWAATFNPDGTLIAAGGSKGIITLINPQSGKIEKSLTGHLAGTVIRSISFSPDGTKLLSGSFDNTAILWDVQTGSVLHVLSGHQGGVTSVAFSPDGTRAVTSSSDGSAKVWDASSGENLYTLVANKYYPYFWVNNVAYTPDGKLLATLSEDGTTRFYYTNIEDVLALARTRITRSLTEKECQLFLHVDTCPNTIVQPAQPVNKTIGMVQIIPVEKVPELGKSNPSLRSEFGTKQVMLEIRNKTTQSLQVFWISTDFVENNVRNLAPSEYTRIQVNDKTAFRVRDLQGKIVFEYIATDFGYQQINLTSTAPLGSTTKSTENASEPEHQQGVDITPNLRTLQGTTPIKLQVVNLTGDPINIVYIDANGFESLYYTLDSGNTVDIDNWDLQAWRLRSTDGKLIYEYVSDKNPTQIVTVNKNLETDVQKQDANGNQRVFASPTDGLRSGDGSTEVTLKITNNTDAPISLTWMSYEGNESAFYTFAPGELLEQGTFETHAWRIRDVDGNLLFEYVSTAQPIQEITINADLIVTVK